MLMTLAGWSKLIDRNSHESKANTKRNSKMSTKNKEKEKATTDHENKEIVNPHI